MKAKALAIILILGTYGNIYAQLNNGIAINNIAAKQIGNILSVEMDINGENASLSSKEKVVLTPVVKLGEQVLELSQVTISGNNRYKADKRSLRFSRETKQPDTYKKSEASAIHYDYEATFEPWMTNAVLAIKQEIYGCATCKESEGFSYVIYPIFTETIGKPEVKFTVSYIAHPTEQVKNRNDQGTAYLDFRIC